MDEPYWEKDSGSVTLLFLLDFSVDFIPLAKVFFWVFLVGWVFKAPFYSNSKAFSRVGFRK